MRIEVCYATHHTQTLVEIELDPGATVAEALAAVANREPFTHLDLRETPVGVFGQRVDQQRLLNDGDRVEIYRHLAMDPKEARRQRAVRPKADKTRD